VGILLLLLEEATNPVSPDPRMVTLALVAGWIITILVGAIGAWVLFLIILGRINLTRLISEPPPPGAPPNAPPGDASLSRFQFLVFTFIIAMGLLVVIFGQSPLNFPTIPGNLLGLLGVSGGSYVIAKGIQANRDVQLSGDGDGTTDNSGGQAGQGNAAAGAAGGAGGAGAGGAGAGGTGGAGGAAGAK